MQFRHGRRHLSVVKEACLLSIREQDFLGFSTAAPYFLKRYYIIVFEVINGKICESLPLIAAAKLPFISNFGCQHRVVRQKANLSP